ncbi:MAG: hypothetical protein KC635_09825 [Myxococcales bacterium]|nr:hypothetical protein [Myxococcales bacterium]MCB9733164.1 hypothetical protein [Deltaproteobacteria bacterium]
MTEGRPTSSPRKGASVWRYLKEAFLFRWNALIFGGAAVAAVISGHPDIALPLVGAAELVYLGGLTANDRFRSAIDAKVARETAPPEAPKATVDANQRLLAMLRGLPRPQEVRFLALRERCREMGEIARGVAGGASVRAPGDIDTAKLDRLLWAFLRLLYSQKGLDEFLAKTDRDQIAAHIEALRLKETKAREDGDERILKSLTDSIATAALRLDNYDQAARNAEFVGVELDRIEGKIQALTEMSVSHEDPDYISSQVDSVAESMASAELAIKEIGRITGLAEDVDAAPAIMAAPIAELESA